MTREEMRGERRRFLKRSAVAVVGLFFAARPTGALATVRAGDGFPRTVLTDVKGGRVDIPGDFRGKVVIVHFWASWCTYCAREFQVLRGLYEKYGHKGVVPLSVNAGETAETAASFAEREKVPYPVLVDPGSSAARRCGVRAIPTTFVVNREGVVKFRIMGEVDAAGLEKIVKGL